MNRKPKFSRGENTWKVIRNNKIQKMALYHCDPWYTKP